VVDQLRRGVVEVAREPALFLAHAHPRLPGRAAREPQQTLPGYGRGLG
jgi:hypothetical protein